MGCQVNCQSGAWGALTQYSLVVTAITLILGLMLINSSGKKSTTVKKPAMSFTSFRYGNHLNVPDILFGNGNQVKKIMNNKMLNKAPVFLVC